MALHSDDDTQFRVPDWTKDVSLAHYLDACPADAMTRGTFLQHPYDLVVEQKGQAPAALYEGMTHRRWLPFHRYPLREFMTLACNAARLAFPDAALSDGLRRVGWAAYPSFAATMAGRVALFAFGDRLEDVLRAAPKAYAIALPAATIRAIELEPNHWRFEMRDVPSFVDTYHYGVLEGAVRGFERLPQIRIKGSDRIGDADFDVRWTT